MNKVSEWIQDILGFSLDTQMKFLTTLITIFLLWLTRKIILKIVYRRNENIHFRYRWRKISTYITVGIGIFVIGRTWFVGFHSISTYLGLLSAGLAIALQDPLVNLAGWAFIVWRRPFSVGDRIQIGDYRGDVIDQRVFMFTLMEIGNWVNADQSTGRIIHIPNGKIFREVLANYSRGFHYIWDEIPVLITFESNWKKAKEILTGIINHKAGNLSESAEKKIKSAAKKFLIFYNKLTPIVYTSVQDCGVLLTIRYLCDPRQRRSDKQDIWESILEAFHECDDIDFAYPTQRFFNHQQEGKGRTFGETGD